MRELLDHTPRCFDLTSHFAFNSASQDVINVTLINHCLDASSQCKVWHLLVRSAMENGTSMSANANSSPLTYAWMPAGQIKR